MELQALCKKAARLIECGKLQDVIAALNGFGVKAVVQLKPADYEAFSDKLQALE